MIVTKDKSGLLFLVAVLVALPIYAHVYVIWKGGFTLIALKLHLYILPFSVSFIVLAYSVYRSLKNRLVISESGILVEDFSPIEFPWGLIRRASIKSQLLPIGGACCWLVLHTSSDEEYVNRKIRRLNKLIGVDGVPVCNLATYSCNVKNILSTINYRAENA